MSTPITDVPVIPDDHCPSFDPALVVFDYDGTLVDQRGGWELLGQLFGTADRIRDRTIAYENGEVTFEEWCLGNIDDWADRGVTEAHIERAGAAVKFTSGATTLLEYLQQVGIPFGIVSGGVYNLTGNTDPYDPAFVHSNEILYEEEIPTDVDVAVGPNDKDDVLHRLCDEYDLDVADVLYVGDSHTDTQAFEVAGTSVLFSPDERLEESAYRLVDYVIPDRDLRHVGACLGWTGESNSEARAGQNS